MGELAQDNVPTWPLSYTNGDEGRGPNHGKAPDSAPDTHMETRERDVWVISTVKAYLCRRPISTPFF